METLKMIFEACKNSPTGVVLTLFVAGSVFVYSDVKEYIMIQRKEQTELNQRFIDALNQIVYRLDRIESQLDISPKTTLNIDEK